MKDILPEIPADTRRYIAAVLWVHGRTLGEIAEVVGWTRPQAKAFTNRLLPKARAQLEDGERQAILDHLASDRQDGGRLRAEHFKPIPLPGRPRDPSRSEIISAIEASWGDCILDARAIKDMRERSQATRDCHDQHRDKLRAAGVDESDIPDPSNIQGRKAVRDIERRAAQRRKREREAKELRELGGAARRPRPLEYLYARRMLADGKAMSTERHSEEMRRYEAGERLQRYIDGARIATLGALDMEKASMGHGGPKAMTLSGYRLYCAQTLGAVRSMMSRSDYLGLEAVLDRDQFTWEAWPEKSARRAAELERIRRLLDVVAVYEKLMSSDAFADRWGAPPSIPDDLPTRHEAAIQADLAAELVESVR